MAFRPASFQTKSAFNTRKPKKSKLQKDKIQVNIPMKNLGYEHDLDDLPTQSESNSSKKLHHAVAQGNLEECNMLLDDGLEVNSVDETDGSTALHILAKTSRNGDDKALQIAELLIERGGEVDARDGKGNTPLHIAAREGLCRLCEMLINEAEASQTEEATKKYLDCLNEKSMTALHLAAQEGHCEAVKLLLRRGAKPNMKDHSSRFPLHYAVDKGCVTCGKALAPHYQGDATLTEGQERLLMVAAKKGRYEACEEIPPEKLDVDYKDKDQNTALHIAARKGYIRIIEFLLKWQASPDLQNSKGCTPLMEAVAKDDEKCVTMLVERGASLTIKNFRGRNVLHIAACNKSHKCMAYLLKQSEVKDLINEKDKEDLTPLEVAVQNNCSKCLKLLKDAGASPFDENEEKESVKYFSSIYKGSDILRIMLSRVKNVNITTEDKLTPLHIAAREGSTEACKSLLRKGARINAVDKDGRTPLHWASRYGHENTVKLLLKEGATKRAKDDKNFTALHWAAFSGKLECCQVLFDKDRGLMKEKDKRHKYALDIAFEQGRFDVFIFLLEKFSQRMMKIPRDLAKRFHLYVHTMLTTKKKSLLEAVIRTNWWETGFGATETKMQGGAPCSLFTDIIKVFPDLASDIMTKCHSKQNFTLLEDNYYMQELKETSDTSHRRNTKVSEQMLGVFSKAPLKQHDSIRKQNYDRRM